MKINYFSDGKLFAGQFLLIIFLLIGTHGCATDSTVKSKVKQNIAHEVIRLELLNSFSAKIYKDPDRDLSSFKTYTFEYTNVDNPLLEKELFKMLGNVLEKKGFKKDANNPELLITMDFKTGKKEIFTPQKTIMIKYYHNIRLKFLDYSKLKNIEKPKIPPLIYLGEIGCEGDSSDIRLIAHDMLESLVIEGQKIKMRFSSLGVSFTGILNKDEIVITEILPEDDSQAKAEALGLHSGDIIRKIEGMSPSFYVNDLKQLKRDLDDGKTGLIHIPNSLRITRFINPIANTNGWEVAFDDREAVLEVECPHRKTIRRY